MEFTPGNTRDEHERQSGSGRGRSLLCLTACFLLFCAFEHDAIFAVAATNKMEKAAAAVAVIPEPKITSVEPQGIQRGTELQFKITGTNLLAVSKVRFSDPKIGAVISGEKKRTETEIWVKIRAAPNLPRAAYELWLATTNKESNRLKIYADDLSNVFETSFPPGVAPEIALPASYWGTLNPMGDTDEIAFRANAGQELVFDLAAKSIGSKANGSLTLLDEKGNTLATQAESEDGDPLLSYTFKQAGRYRMRVADVASEGSPDYYYRLSMGQLPEVIGVFPMSVRTNRSAQVKLLGFNLRGKDTIQIAPINAGEIKVPLDPEKYRWRGEFKILATTNIELSETEPNDTPASANAMTVPCVICGTISAPTGARNDVDLYRFNAKAGEQLIIETDAARRGSPVDTKIEILDAQGQPIERLQLQAVRDSAINFRGITSEATDVRVDNWEEMELNQYLYMQGEVCRLFRLPQGPDSGFLFYSAGGKRRDYFDTSPADHPLDSPCYIVEAHPAAEKLKPNGLPVFPVYYENDDGGDRDSGSDSRLHFKAPGDGAFLVRVSDIRGRGGERFTYRLIVRDARPDFNVTLDGGSPTISPGTGKGFTVRAERMDGFDGDIRVVISNPPPGFVISSPLVIQAGHSEAKGTIYCAANAVEPATDIVKNMKITAFADVEGSARVREVNGFDKIKIGEPAKLIVWVADSQPATTNLSAPPPGEHPLELTIAPGGTATAWIEIKRQNGFEDLAKFDAENLPHGVIIDDIGLSGVMIPKGENYRQIFLKARNWVPETDRLFYIQADQAGEPSSSPVMLRVRKARDAESAKN